MLNFPQHIADTTDGFLLLINRGQQYLFCKNDMSETVVDVNSSLHNNILISNECNGET